MTAATTDNAPMGASTESSLTDEISGRSVARIRSRDESALRATYEIRGRGPGSQTGSIEEWLAKAGHEDDGQEIRQFDLRQAWEGVVSSVSSEDFVAVLYNLTTPEAPEEEVTIPLEEISQSDLALVAPGAAFNWAIGYSQFKTGQKERTSRIRFKRTPPLTRAERARAKRAAEKFDVLLDD